MNPKKLSQLQAAARRGDQSAIAELLEITKSAVGLKQLHVIAKKKEERWAKAKRAEFKKEPPREEGHWEHLQKRRVTDYIPMLPGGAPGLGKKK